MKKLLSAVAVVVLSVGLAGCSQSAKTPDPDVVAVANTYETFVSGVFTIDDAAVQTAYKQSQVEVGSSDTPSDAQKKAVVDDFKALAPDAFGLLDLSGMTVNEQGRAVTGAALTVLKADGANVTVTVPVDAIHVDGSKATIDKGEVRVNYTQGNSSVAPLVLSDAEKAKLGDVKLVKKDGKWLISSTSGVFDEIVK